MKHINFSGRVFIYLFSAAFLFSLYGCSQTERNSETPPAVSVTDEPLNLSAGKDPTPAPEQTAIPDNALSSETANDVKAPNTPETADPSPISSNGTYYALLDVGLWETLIVSDYSSKSFHFDFAKSDISGEAEFSDDGYAYYYDSTGQAINFKFENAEILVDAGYHYTSLRACYAPAKPDIESPSISPLQAYKSVLLDNAEFYSTDYKENVTLSKITEPINGNIPVKIWRFTVTDLDNNGTPEVILWLVRNMDIDLSFEILRYDGDTVRHYGITPRAFSDLKADGTFLTSSGAGDWGFSTISFDKNSYDTDKFTFCESFLTSANNLGELYYVNHESVGEEHFRTTVNQQNAKPNAAWFDFTQTNLETYLTD